MSVSKTEDGLELKDLKSSVESLPVLLGVLVTDRRFLHFGVFSS